MRIVIAAIGKLKAGAERELCDRYISRYDAAGRSHGLSAIKLVELNEGRASSAAERQTDEANRLLTATADAGVLVVLDGGGKALSSVDLARWIGRQRDDGTGTIAFLIGGADGHGGSVKSAAALTFSLGAITLPHGLARIVLVEQLYRATTILSGHPYHRA
jgi:23S rRNA (pseudouridine1915-N3)-methyltransferase